MTETYGQKPTEDLGQFIAKRGLTRLLNEEIPVDIARIAKVVGVTSVTASDIPAAGMLVPTNGQFRILVNRELELERQRFSCAHELAHMLLSPAGSGAMRRTPVAADNGLERQCEAMAALLLMPDPTFSKLALEEKPGILTIEKLARIFLTSVQATALRFLDVVKEPCVLIVSEVKYGQVGSKLRIRWSYQNTKRSDGKSLYFIPRGGTLRLAGAMNASQSGRLESGIEDFRLGGLRRSAYAESKNFGNRRYRYVMTLVFPNSGT